MGIQTMGFHVPDEQSCVQPLTRQNSWYSLTLNEVENRLGHMGKPLANVNLDELLKFIWTAQSNLSTSQLEIDNTYLQHQASLMLVRSFSGKTVNEVWREIQEGDDNNNNNKNRVDDECKEGRKLSLGEITLEDFLVKAGSFAAKVSVGPTMGLGNEVMKQTFMPQIGLSPSTSIDTLSDTLSDTPKPSRKRSDVDAIEKTLERRLRRKIKNRESAARSRARKQAYHNELVNKVTHLEEENLKLRNEKEREEMLLLKLSPEPRYQLRRTSSL